jgi:hypothetical protein
MGLMSPQNAMFGRGLVLDLMYVQRIMTINQGTNDFDLGKTHHAETWRLTITSHQRPEPKQCLAK